MVVTLSMRGQQPFYYPVSGTSSYNREPCFGSGLATSDCSVALTKLVQSNLYIAMHRYLISGTVSTLAILSQNFQDKQKQSY